MEKAKKILLSDAIATAIESERRAVKYKTAFGCACVVIAGLLLKRR